MIEEKQDTCRALFQSPCAEAVQWLCGKISLSQGHRWAERVRRVGTGVYGKVGTEEDTGGRPVLTASVSSLKWGAESPAESQNGGRGGRGLKREKA